MKKYRSLSKSLTYRIMAVVLVMIAVITNIINVHVGNYMADEAQERYERVLQRDHEEFRRRLSDVMVAIKNNLEDVENGVDNPDKVMRHMNRVLQVNPTIITCGLLYKPGYFPDRKRCVEIIATHDSLGAVHLRNIENDNNVYLERQWFKDCIANDSADWSDVYFEQDLIPGVTNRRQLTTYCYPVHDKQGKTVAVFGADMPLEFLRHEITDDLHEIIKKYEKDCEHHSYNFVIDRDGNYILHPDDERILKDNFFEVAKRSGNQIDDDVVANMKKGKPGSAKIVIDGIPSWIYHRPVKHMDWMIAIVVPQEAISHNGRILTTIILAVAILGMLAIYFISRQMIKKTTQPLHFFALSAEEVAKGNFSSPLPEVKRNDEVKVLRDSFKAMQNSLSIYVEEIKNTTAEKTAIKNEMANARAIQMAMVPNRFPPEHSPIDIYGVMEPAKSVGGDLFDFIMRDNRLFFCIGDVSGKGIPAALLMAVMKAMFRGEARRSDNAADIVNSMNRNLCAENTEGYFVTMFIGILDPTTGHLDYCNAGHEVPLVGGKPLAVMRNLPVGALPNWKYEGQETMLRNGDILFLFTDGLSEAENADGKLFGRHHVWDVVGGHTDYTPRELAELVKKEVSLFVGDTEQSDDLTLLIIKLNNIQSSKYSAQLSMRADMDDIEQMDTFIAEASQQAGFTTKEAKQIRLALEEAVANIINYSHATFIDLNASIVDGCLKVTVIDDGIPFDATADSPTDLSLPPNQRPPGGLGIMLLHQMTDMLDYKRIDNSNVLTLMKKMKN